MRRPVGFSLVEVTMALGIAAFVLIALFALLPVGLGSNRSSVQQTVAVNLSTAVVADLQQAPAGAGAVSPRYGVPVNPPVSFVLYLDESGAVVPREQALFQASIVLEGPPAGQRNATRGSLALAWPAGAAEPANSVVTFVALDRN